jgi:6-pyruvoyltetrahydropterin/6-carboxytetrahydropterin synthase
VPTFLTRRITFESAHRYWRADWSVDENKRVFGSWATSEFHGHEYVCDVTVTGEVDGVTGMLVDLGRLGSSARVSEVRVAEDETISATHRLDDFTA